MVASWAMRNWPKQAANLRKYLSSSLSTMVYWRAGNLFRYLARVGWFMLYIMGVSTSIPPYSRTLLVTYSSRRALIILPLG